MHTLKLCMLKTGLFHASGIIIWISLFQHKMLNSELASSCPNEWNDKVE